MSLSQWLQTKRTVYKNAITNAKERYTAGDGSDPAVAYAAILNDATAYFDSTGDGTADKPIDFLMPPSYNQAGALQNAENNNTAFFGSSPNATEAMILAFEAYLQANPADAGKLGLAVEYNNTSALGRKDLGGGGHVTHSGTTERRKWQGTAQHTFAGGILVGKDDKIVAALGTDGFDNADTIDGFGTDTLNYFDGVPGSKGTSQPGTTVFGGDVVVSGSIQGVDGVVIVDDVLQLEQLGPTSNSSAAAIGVTPDGKIHLRHRGEGFLDLIEEDERRQIEDKRFVTGQNTSSQRYGTSLIPNSGFGYLESTTSPDPYVEQIANIATFGSTTSQLLIQGGSELGIAQLNYDSGSSGFIGSGGGLIFQAIPITSERYTIRIRFEGTVQENLDAGGTSEGLFLEFHETTQEDLGGKLYIKKNGSPSNSATSSGSSDKETELFTATTEGGKVMTVKAPNNSTAGTPVDGLAIPNSYTVKSFVYQPTAGTKNASLVLFAANYAGKINIDYIVMTEQPPTAQEIQSLANEAALDILDETANKITDSRMSDVSNWLGLNSTITNSLDGNVNGDEAINMQVTSYPSPSGINAVTPVWGRNGILSSRTSADDDEYVIGVRLKALPKSADSDNPTDASISLYVVENMTSTSSPFSVSNGPIESRPNAAGNASDNFYQKTIDTVLIDNAGEIIGTGAASHRLVYHATNPKIHSPNLAESITEFDINTQVDKDPDASFDSDGDGTPNNDYQNGYVNLIGTYTRSKREFAGSTRISETGGVNDLVLAAPYDRNDITSTVTASEFCVGLEVNGNSEFLIDYFYVKKQSTSLNIATTLADSAYSDAEGFVTATNEALVRESGSIISNASMALLDSSGLPVGYYPYTGSTITPLLLGGEDRQVSVTNSSSSGVRRMVTPPFQLGQADKFSIGLRVKGASATARIRVRVMWLHPGEGDNGQLPTGKETLVAQTSGYDAKVFQSTTAVSYEYLSPLHNVGSSDFTSLLWTWDRTPVTDNVLDEATSTNARNAKVAALEIHTYTGGHEDFIIDYVLVKEQTCSFDLADASAQLRRDEAISQIGNALDNLNSAMNQETGSLLANSTFMAYDYNAAGGSTSIATNGTSGIQIPKNWLVTGTGLSDRKSFVRVVNTSETVTDGYGASIPVAGEYLPSSPPGLLGGGARLQHSGTNDVGILSSYFTLPIGGAASSETIGSTTVSPTGKYLVAIQFRTDPNYSYAGLDKSGIRIIAHETKEVPSNGSVNLSFALATSNGGNVDPEGDVTITDPAYKHSSLAYSDGSLVETFNANGSNYNAQALQIIKMSDTNDADVGTDADDFIEVWTDNTTWHTVGGTYSPAADMKYVCFEFRFETNELNARYFIDYVTLTSQSIDADFADTLAQARTEGAIDNLQDEPQVPGNLIANPYFSSANLTSTTDTFPAQWLISGQNFIQGSGANPATQTQYIEADKWVYYDTANKTGLRVAGGRGGLISKAFRVTSPDYEIKVRYRIDGSTDTTNGMIVCALEYDYDLPTGVQFIRSYDANTHPDRQSIAVLRSRFRELQEIKDVTPQTMTTHTVEYLPTGAEPSEGTQPSITPKYVSIGLWPMESTNTTGYSVEFITCTVDPTATGNRLLGDYQNTPGPNMMQNTSGTRSHTDFVNDYRKASSSGWYATVASQVITNLGISGLFNVLSGNPTSPQRPVMDLTNQTQIAPGHSLTVLRKDYANTSSVVSTAYYRCFGSGTGHNSNDELSLTDGSQATNFDAEFAANNRYRGLVYAGTAHHYRESSSSSSNLKGVSFYSPKVTPYIGITSNSQGMWIKNPVDGYSRVYFYDENSKNRWALFYYDGHTPDDKMYFEHKGNLGTEVDGQYWLTPDPTDGAISISFTGQHRCIPIDDDLKEKIGLICVSTGNFDTRSYSDKNTKQVSINEAHPIIDISSKRNQKSVFGVISGQETIGTGTGDQRGFSFQVGGFGSHIPIADDDDQRLLINSIGEGGIWICNINGDLENGDYITSCEIPGYGMLQDDDLLHNYTVAKITQDCNFELDNSKYDCVEFEFEGQTYRKAFVGCTYHCG